MVWLEDIYDRKPIAFGIWLSLGSHAAAELAALAGFDWVLLDLEHGLGGEDEVLRSLQVLARTDTAVVVRVPSSESDVIKRVLDFGAAGVMAPTIESGEEARSFVSRLKYPPQGVRGLTSSSRAASFGYSFSDYFQKANDKMSGIVQIETATAVEHIEQIATLEGVDILFVGHSDLSLSLGCYGDLRSSAVQRAEDLVLAACSRHGKRAGMLLKPGSDVSAYLDKGFTFIALGSDLGCLRSSFHTLLQSID